MDHPRRLIRSKSFWIALSLLSLVALRPTYAFRNGQFASLVLGQPGFFSGAPPAQVSAATLRLPAAVAVDPSTGKVFVADSGHNRVLRFAALEQLRNGAEAEGVLGQPDFSTKMHATTQSGMATPSGLAVDTSGRLWVADTFNHRVLRFDNAAGKPNGAPADGVLGQPDFATNVLTTTQSSLVRPQGLALDGTGRLWVADSYNSRAVSFDNAASKPNGAPADWVLGQTNFTEANVDWPLHMSNPAGIAADQGSAHVWVADSNHYRILRYDSPLTEPLGSPPDGVIGARDFLPAALPPATPKLLRYPYHLALDSAGNLWVADTNQSRILRFDSAASRPNFPDADLVIGQPNMTSADNGASMHGLTFPMGAAVDGAGRLWVADTEDNRVLMFDPAGGPPTPGPVYLPQVQQLQWIPTRTPTRTPIPPQCLLGSGGPESCLQGQPAAATPTPTREPRPRTR